MRFYRAFFICIALLLSTVGFSQRATVTAMNYDISDNLDLQAVASIFGDSRDLADFERRLNDPQSQISNLDLNRDNYVDYLRVIEVTEGQTHLIVIQAVLGQDMFQDVATIEVEKDRKNRVQVQIVGNEYLYGRNYIYEPVYVSTPILFDVFWSVSYRPYYSSWYWNYYPTYYSPWEPYPIYRYRNNIHVHINNSNRYVYAADRRSSRSVRLLRDVRGNSYERENPQYSFSQRNSNVSNRYVLDQNRSSSSRTVQNQSGNLNSSSRSTSVNNSGRQVNSSSRENSTTTSRPVNSSREVNSSSSRSTNANTSTRVAPATSASSRVSTSSSRSSFDSSSRASSVSSQPARIERSAPVSRSNSSFNNSSSSSRSSSSMSSGRSSGSFSSGASSSRGSSSGNTSSSRGSSGGSSSRSSSR